MWSYFCKLTVIRREKQADTTALGMYLYAHSAPSDENSSYFLPLT